MDNENHGPTATMMEPGLAEKTSPETVTQPDRTTEHERISSLETTCNMLRSDIDRLAKQLGSVEADLATKTDDGGISDPETERNAAWLNRVLHKYFALDRPDVKAG